MKKYKNNISFFLLFLFLGLKVVSLHSFTHLESDAFNNDCEICEFVIVSNETDLTTNDLISSPTQIMNLFKEQNFYAHAYKFEQSLIDNSLFCRPPPTS
ncbi:MAG: hypothetical protein ACI8PF_000253 [Flavobacteriaceae bacterium]